jgi:putative ABC transport system permease protein
MRNKRRSVLNIVAVAIGITIMINALGWLRGLTATVYDSVISIDTGHVQILNRDYQAEKRRLPLDLMVSDYPAIMKKVVSMPGVSGVTARIDTAGELSNGVNTAMVMIRAVLPENEAKVTNLKTSVINGSYFSKPGSVIIGQGLARKLKLAPGSQIFVSCLDRYGVRNIVDSEVAGIFSFGYPTMDDNMIFMDMGKAMDLLSLDNRVTRIVVKLNPEADSSIATKTTARLLADRKDLAVYEWREFAQTIVVSIESRIAIISSIFGILFLLIIIGILNSMSMAVEERFREIGTMRAIGMKRRNLIFMFLSEGCWLGILGSVAALIVSVFLIWFFSSHGVDVKQFMPKEVPIPFTALLTPRYLPGDIVMSFAIGALMAVVGSIIPAERAGKMIIQDALGSHM